MLYHKSPRLSIIRGKKRRVSLSSFCVMTDALRFKFVRLKV